MVAPIPLPPPVKISLLPQEKEGACQFTGEFYATSNAVRCFGAAAVTTAYLMLRKKVVAGEHLDYLQVFEISGERLWIIDDGDVVTALLPEDY